MGEHTHDSECELYSEACGCDSRHALKQRCDELAEALQQVSNQLKQAGASIPAPENKGTAESAIATGMSIALLLIEEAIAEYRQRDR